MATSYTVTLVRGTVSATFDVAALKRDRPESLELARRLAKEYFIVLKELETAKAENEDLSAIIAALRADLEVRNQQVQILKSHLYKAYEAIPCKAS